jgi:DNA polymerase I-like protein with 3'-5' exonuclease and polymerase domains
MSSKAFILQRICIFAGKPIDPDSDEQVKHLLRSEFNIQLPQRRSMNESLAAAASNHEIVDLILKYRGAC